MEVVGEIPELEGDPFVEVPPQPIAAKPAKAARAVAVSSPSVELDMADERSVRDWINSLAGEGEVKVNISRKKPVVGPGGENIGGSLETVSDRIDEEYLREMWGGGTFSLKVMTPTRNGDFKYYKGRQIVIAGKPKMHGQICGEGGAVPIAAPSAADDSLANRAFETMERLQREARIEATQTRQQQQPQGLDIAALQALNAPILQQLAQAQQTIADLQQQMIAMSNKPPVRDEFRDKLMERALDGESARIEALRAQYENRIEKLRDSHDDQLKRIEDRHADDIKRLESRHEREIKLVEKTQDSQVKNADVSYATRLDSLKEQIARLEADRTAMAAKLAALEARKDQTMKEKVEEIGALQEVMEGFGGKGDDDEKWYEKVISTVGSLPAVNGVLEKLAGGSPQQQQAALQQQQLPPPGVPFQTGDGNIYVRDAAGNVQIIDQAQLRQRRALQGARSRRKAGAPTPGMGGETEIEEGLADDDGAGGLEPQVPVGRPPAPSEVKIAVNFMENALKNGTPPEAFAATARNLMPTDIMQYIQQVGPEEFLNKTARLESGSPLASIKGREWCRKVFKHLVGDPTE